MSYAPFVRILLRYGAMALVSHGLLVPDLSADTDMIAIGEIVIGSLVAAGAEFWHWIVLKREEREKLNVPSGT